MSDPIDTLARQLAGGLGPAELAARWDAGRERKAPGVTAPTPEQQAAIAAYRERLRAYPAAAPDILHTRAPRQQMPYDKARRLVWRRLIERGEQIAALTGADFAWDFQASGWDRLVPGLIRYFIQDDGSPYPLHKGLFLYGPPGTGKTELMRIFADFTREEGLSTAFEFTSLSEVYTRARVSDAYDPITPNVQQSRCFDELGRYTGAVLRFGNPVDLNEAIIEQRYTRFARYGQITHFIANATPNDAKNMFTDMLFDRLRAMCTGVEFAGPSQRT